jgi:hypothetical protein
MVDRFHARAGDQMFAIETEDGILLTPYDPTFDKAMKLYARFSRKYRNALRELAQ